MGTINISFIINRQSKSTSRKIIPGEVYQPLGFPNNIPLTCAEAIRLNISINQTLLCSAFHHHSDWFDCDLYTAHYYNNIKTIIFKLKDMESISGWT